MSKVKEPRQEVLASLCGKRAAQAEKADKKGKPAKIAKPDKLVKPDQKGKPHLGTTLPRCDEISSLAWQEWRIQVAIHS